MMQELLPSSTWPHCAAFIWGLYQSDAFLALINQPHSSIPECTPLWNAFLGATVFPTKFMWSGVIRLQVKREAGRAHRLNFRLNFTRIKPVLKHCAVRRIAICIVIF